MAHSEIALHESRNGKAAVVCSRALQKQHGAFPGTPGMNTRNVLCVALSTSPRLLHRDGGISRALQPIVHSELGLGRDHGVLGVPCRPTLACVGFNHMG